MIEFKKYNSVENHYREKTIDYYRMHGLENIRYELTEKVHGANFSMWTDGYEVKVASRNQWVDGTFYGCQEVLEKYSAALGTLQAGVSQAEGKNSVIGVYGELFGPSIQKGIRYGNEKDFVAFDFRVNGVWVSPEYSRGALEAAGFNYVPVLAIVDSLTKALKTPNDFISLTGLRKGIEDDDNIAEGFVIKPYEEQHMYIGDDRVILKSKNDKWSEKSKAPKKSKAPTKDDPLKPLIEPYVNVNRLAAVTSKLGEITVKDFGVVIKELCADVIEDMVKDGDAPEDWRHLDDYKTLGASVNKVVVPFLKKELLPKL